MKKLAFINIFVICLLLVSCEDDEPTVAPDIDLAAHSISFAVAPTSEFEGIATITGVVKNIGDDYRSATGQQQATLYERPLGNLTGTVVAQSAFTNLDAGDSITLTYERDWNRSSPSEGEFPPDYVLIISYDPDLLLDGNTANDDTNSSNNQKEENGRDINELF